MYWPHHPQFDACVCPDAPESQSKPIEHIVALATLAHQSHNIGIQRKGAVQLGITYEHQKPEPAAAAAAPSSASTAGYLGNPHRDVPRRGQLHLHATGLSNIRSA